jgi:hypothetical protein
MKIFSPSLKGQMKDCILAIIWPREEIITFFKNHSCPKNVLKTIEKWKEENLSRARMITEVFNALGNQNDNGTMHFNLMLESLSNWTYFDEYWFKDQKKLDLNDAKKKIAELKFIKNNDIEKARKRIDEETQRTETLKKKYASLAEMKEDFNKISLNSETSQARGFALEKFLTKMANFYDLKVTEAFKIKGTQIDGTIKYDGENYLIEAKWHDRQLSDEPLMAFCHKQGINMHGRGIFISINGITEGCFIMLKNSSVKNTIIFDGEDLTLILEEMITLPQALEKKVHAAQTRGEFYINPITAKSKIKL